MEKYYFLFIAVFILISLFGNEYNNNIQHKLSIEQIQKMKEKMKSFELTDEQKKEEQDDINQLKHVQKTRTEEDELNFLKELLIQFDPKSKGWIYKGDYRKFLRLIYLEHIKSDQETFSYQHQAFIMNAIDVFIHEQNHPGKISYSRISKDLDSNRIYHIANHNLAKYNNQIYDEQNNNQEL